MSYEFASGYRIRNQWAPHFLTFTISGWIDIFSREVYRKMIIESFKFCQDRKGLKISAYVIMTNHIHVIWTAKNGDLSDIIRDFKTFTSKEIISLINTENESRRHWLLHLFRFYGKRTNGNTEFKVWSGDNHAEEIQSLSFYHQKLEYIHMNPVRAGITKVPEAYQYSSAAINKGTTGLLRIVPLFMAK